MNHIIALVLLGCFIPAIIGFSFIHHHCSGCESNKTEALLSIIHHQHEHDDCFCSASVAEHCNDNQEQSCTCHDANDSKHQHNCFVDLKRLDIPGTDFASARTLPNPAELIVLIDFATSTILSKKVLNISDKSTSYCFTDPPLIQTNLSVFHCVFRL